MAGAVIAYTMGVDLHTSYEPIDSSNEDNGLRAIDDMRVGSFLGAYGCIHQYYDPTLAIQDALLDIGREVYAAFETSPSRAPWHVYTKAAKQLKELGL